MRYFATFITLLALLLLAPINVFGQVHGVLSGTVTDPGGGVLTNVEVSLRNVNTNAQRSTTTDEQGFYIVNEVVPGSYELTAKCNCTGFSEAVMKLSVNVGQSSVLDVTLPVAGVATEVRVLERTPLVDSTKVEVSQVIAEQRIQNLPVSGRNFIDFVLLSPAVSLGRSNRNGGAMLEPDVGVGATAVTRLAFAGQQEYFTFFAVDGVDNNQTVTRLQRASPSLEAVQEFRIVNSNYTTEYGRALGGIVNIVTKSGGNLLQLRGAATGGIANLPELRRGQHQRDQCCEAVVRSQPGELVHSEDERLSPDFRSRRSCVHEFAQRKSAVFDVGRRQQARQRRLRAQHQSSLNRPRQQRARPDALRKFDLNPEPEVYQRTARASGAAQL